MSLSTKLHTAIVFPKAVVLTAKDEVHAKLEDHRALKTVKEAMKDQALQVGHAMLATQRAEEAAAKAAAEAEAAINTETQEVPAS